MSEVEELPSGEVEFVDDTLTEAFGDGDGRVEVLVRPVCSRDEFVEVVSDASFGDCWEELGHASLVGELSEDECELLLECEVVEALELNEPVELL